MHPATPQADMAIVNAVDTLNRHTATLKTLRAELSEMRMPIDAANDRLDHTDDLLAIVKRQLDDAYAAMESDFTRILKSDDARYSDDFADENERAANDDGATREAA